MLYRVIDRAVLDVANDHNAFKTSGTTHLTTQHNIPESATNL
jgi:hypothetical protein